MENAAHTTLMIACGALAKDIVALKAELGLSDESFAVQCLPAIYHNHPEKIVPALKAILDERAGDYDSVIVGYGDCGTGGGLDRLLADYPSAERLPGAHCYAFFSGLPEFDAMMEEELGTFFLTDYIVRHFETLVVKGMGLDRFPNLRDDYFKHYVRAVYISQDLNAGLMDEAKQCADYLGLAFEHRYTGHGELSAFMANAKTEETAHA